MKIKPRDNTGGTLHVRTNPKFAKANQIEAVHSWKTGFQVLIFRSRENLEKFAATENLEIKESVG